MDAWRLELESRRLRRSSIVVAGYSLFRDDGARLDVLGKSRESAENFRYTNGEFGIEFTATLFDAEGLNPSDTYSVWLKPAVVRLARNDPASLEKLRQCQGKYEKEIAEALVAWSKLRPNPPTAVDRVRFD